ncbi:MAG: diacylglycerol/lipid kinase family protein [Prevotella sp.]
MDNGQRLGILYCPKHEDLKKNKRWARIEKYLTDRGVAFDFIQSESASGVERLVRMMVNNGYTTIVIVGGDSALNDAVNCLMNFEARVRNGITIGIIPNGTMNDFSHFWGLKENEVPQAIDAIIKHRVRKIDVGCVKYSNHKNETCRTYFLNCINMGFIASVMNLRRQTRHFLGSRMLSFLFSFILMIFKRKEYKMRLNINTDVVERNIMTVCVGNASGFGQTPNAVPYNGMLDVSVVCHSGITQLFQGIYLFLKGKLLNHKNVHSYRTQKVDVEQAEKMPVGVDGRLIEGPNGAFSITVEQEVINFIIP